MGDDAHKIQRRPLVHTVFCDPKILVGGPKPKLTTFTNKGENAVSISSPPRTLCGFWFDSKNDVHLSLCSVNFVSLIALKVSKKFCFARVLLQNTLKQ